MSRMGRALYLHTPARCPSQAHRTEWGTHRSACGGPANSGLATGASSIKSVDQRNVFGGFARTQLDPCYHQDCDDVGNVSEAALKIVRARTCEPRVRVGPAAKQTGWCVGTHRPRRRHRTCCSSCRPRRTCAPSCKARRSRHRRSIYHSADPPSQKPAAACAFEAAFLCVFETYKDRNVWGA